MKTLKIGTDRERIELTWTTDGTGAVTGEAYFLGWDMIADIVAGEFRHPYTGQEYRVLVPHPGAKSNYATVQELTWRTVGYGVPSNDTQIVIE